MSANSNQKSNAALYGIKPGMWCNHHKKRWRLDSHTYLILPEHVKPLRGVLLHSDGYCYWDKMARPYYLLAAVGFYLRRPE